MVKCTRLLWFLRFYFSDGLRSIYSWERLMKSAASSKFSSDRELQESITEFERKYLNTAASLPFMFQFSSGCDHACHERVEAKLNKMGYFHYDIVNENHALLYIDGSTSNNLKNELNDVVMDAAPLLPSLKVSKYIDIKSYCAVYSKMDFFVALFPLSEIEIESFCIVISSLVANYNIETSDFELSALKSNSSDNAITVTCKCDNISNIETILHLLASRHEVNWVEERQPVEVAAKYAVGVIQSDSSELNIMHKANLTGGGQIIGIADTGIDASSCFFLDVEAEFPYDAVNLNHRKIVYYNTFVNGEDSVEGHGTGVSSSAAGYCTTLDGYEDYNGAAYDAKIAFFDIGDTSGKLTTPTNNYANLYQVLYNVGSRVQSMSWGSKSNTYTADSRYVDQFMWTNADGIVLIAAGNSGDNGPKSVGSPATTKSGVSVGASMNDELSWNAFGESRGDSQNYGFHKDSLASFSSRGPTSDGRIKPEVTGPGWYVTYSKCVYPATDYYQCGVSSGKGTSFATPLLAGHAALVRQYFLEGFYYSGRYDIDRGFNPSGALIKACLIHGAMALESITDSTDGSVTYNTAQPDNNQGFGRTVLKNTLSFSGDPTLGGSSGGVNMYVRGSATPGTDEYVKMTATGQKHEYVINIGNGTSPLRITMAYTDYFGAFGSDKVLFNNLDIRLYNDTHEFYPSIVNNAAGTADDTNPVEYIEVLFPSGTYTLEVTATWIIKQPQAYALVVTGEVGQFAYTPSYATVKTGLTNKAKIAIAIMTILACLLISCVCCIVKYNREVKKQNAPRAVELSQKNRV